MKKRIYFLFVILALLTSVVVWRKPLTYQMVCLGFKYFTEKSIGEKISFHNFHLEKNQITLIDPKIGSQSKSAKNGGTFIEADEAVIAYDIDWFARKIKVDLNLKRPKIYLVKTVSYKPSLKGFISDKKGLFEIRTSLTVDEGEFQLIDKTSHEEVLTQKIQFEADTELADENQMAFVIKLTQNESRAKSFISLKDDQMSFKVDLEDVGVSKLHDILCFWTSTQLKDERSLNCKSGALSGSLDLQIKKAQLPELETRLEVKDLCLNDKKTLISTDIPTALLEIKTACLLSENKDYSLKEMLEALIESSNGVIDIPYGAEILYQKNELEILRSPDMKGQIKLTKDQPTTIHFEGDISNAGQKSRFTLDGSGLLTMLKGELDIKMRHDFLPEAKLRLSLDPYGINQHKLYGQMTHFSHKEVHFIQKLLMPFYPTLQSIDLQNGNLSSNFQCLFKNYRLKELSVGDFALVDASLNGYDWIEDVENVTLEGSCALSFENKEPLKTITAQALFKGKSLSIKGNSFTGLEGSCEVAQGKVEKGVLKALFSNMKAELNWDLERSIDPLTVLMVGKGENFIQFAPAKLKEAYLPVFSGENLKLGFSGAISGDLLNISGKCEVGQNEPAYFGFKVGKKHKEEDQKEQFRIFWDNFISPLKTMPSLSYFEKALSLNYGSNFYLKEGWFEFKKVPIEKFVSPILFGETTILFKGTSDIKGQFDQAGLSLSYDHYNLSFDHQYFSIDIDSEKSVYGPGFHYFNFNKNTHFGKVFVQEAQCSVKSAHLDFDRVSGWIEITPDRIYANQLDAGIFDLQLKSKLDLNFLGDGNLDLLLNLSELKGDLSHFKTLFGSMEGAFFESLPLEGKIEVDPENAYFHLIKKEKVQTKIGLSGKLTEGKAPFLGQQPLTQVECKFLYDSDLQVIEIKDFESKWKSHRNQTYGLFSNYFKINLFVDEPSQFDVKIKNSYQDCARLLGKLYLNLGQQKPTLKIILDQKASHIGSVNLTNVYFALNESFKLDYLNVNFACNLTSVNRDISLAQNLIPQLSGSALTALKLADIKGDVSGQWLYDHSQEKHQFFIWGDQVKIGETKGGFFQVKGYKNNKFTQIEDLTYLDLKASCRLEEKTFCFFINDLKLTSGNDLKIDLSGIYCKLFNSFQMDVEKFYCNINELKKLDLFSSIPYIKGASGVIDLKGKAEGGYFKGDMNYSLDLYGGSTSLKIQEILFGDDEMKCSFKGNSKGFKIEHFESRFLEAFQKPIDATLIGNNLEFKEVISNSKVGDIQFAISAESLRSVQSILKEKWSLNIPESSFSIKKEGLLEGNLKYNPEDVNHPFSLHLKEGRYALLDQVYFLNHCNLFYGDAGLTIEAKGPIYNKPYWLEYKKENFKKNRYKLNIYDQDPSILKAPHLTIECLEKPAGTVIKNIRGSVAGMRFDFIHRPEKDTSYAHVLMGQMQIQGDELVKRLPWDVASKLEKFSFGKGYFLTGQLKLPKEATKDFVFDGLFGGQDFDLLGFEFKSLSSSINCSLQNFLIKDLKVSDLSGELAVDKIDISKNDSGYHLNIPNLTLKDFKPSLMHRSHEGPVKHKPLIIERLELNDVKGNLSDINTLCAKGFFTFEKTPKKQASFLDIPVHLISKLGLDLTMLNPVEGKVIFEIKNQKLIFTKLLEVYSHDKHCHFTLPKYPDVSYMDFDGNLHIKIKMKQYVLLKITEPFMISVQGHYSAPRYSFTRKKMVVDVPQRSADKASL